MRAISRDQLALKENGLTLIDTELSYIEGNKCAIRE
jgi:hypothetical protein